MTDIRINYIGDFATVADLPATADTGDRALVMAPPGGLRSTFYRWTGAAWESELAPLSGTLRLYVDGTAGNDSASGTGGWANAWKTWSQSYASVCALLCLEPNSLVIILYVRGAFTEELNGIFYQTGSSRVHIVHAITDFDTIRTGTVAAVGGEAGPPKHGLERLTLAGAALDGTEVGMTLKLVDPVSGSISTCTIVRIDVGSQYVWTTQLILEFPAWVAASPADATVLRPSMYTSKPITLEFPRLAGADMAAGVDTLPASHVIGLRCGGSFIVKGSSVNIGACYARSLAGTWQGISVIGEGHTPTGGILMAYYRSVVGADQYYLSDALAAEFGLIGGPLPTTANIVSNASGKVYGLGSSNVQVYGFCDKDVGSLGGVTNIVVSRASFTYARSSGISSNVVCLNVIPRGDATNGCFYSYLGAWIDASKFSLLDLPATGVAYVFRCRRGGIIRAPAITVEGNNTGSGTCRLAYIDGGVMRFDSGLPDTLKAKTSQIEFSNMGGECHLGATTIGAREGAGNGDIILDGGGIIRITGNFSKSATNPSGGGTAKPVVYARGAGRIVQDPAYSFTLPAGSGNNATDYGAAGAIDASVQVQMRLGTFTGAGGGTTGALVSLRNVSSLVHKGAGPSGVAPLDLGGLPAAVPWPVAGVGPYDDNGAVLPQGCLCIPGVA